MILIYLGHQNTLAMLCIVIGIFKWTACVPALELWLQGKISLSLA